MAEGDVFRKNFLRCRLNFSEIVPAGLRENAPFRGIGGNAKMPRPRAHPSRETRKADMGSEEEKAKAAPRKAEGAKSTLRGILVGLDW